MMKPSARPNLNRVRPFSSLRELVCSRQPGGRSPFSALVALEGGLLSLLSRQLVIPVVVSDASYFSSSR
jgi:hypothetical protein